MSLLIPNTEIRNLYYNGQKVKAAYIDGEKVWTQKHRVDWILDDDAQTVLKTEYVTDGQSANPPVEQEWMDDYYSYLINNWDTSHDSILTDTEIHAQSRAMALYAFRNGYGVNSALNANLSGNPDCAMFGFTETISFTDNTSNMSYGSAEGGQISQYEILCSHTGKSNSGYSEFRSARYKAALLDAASIRAAGFSRLRFTGSYSFGKGSVYKAANLRVAFVALQSTAAVSTTTTSGVVSNNKWQVRYNTSPTSTSNTVAVSAVSGAINGTINIPENGSYYMIVGELTKAFGGTAQIRIDNIWVE